LTAAINQNDHLLKTWLEDVNRFRKSRTVWDVSKQKYVFAFGENEGDEVLIEAASFVAAIKHAVGNTHD
jgi:hypothetical protein